MTEFANPVEIDEDSAMYQRAYYDGLIQFSYVPDFKSTEEEQNWCAGLRAGWKAKGEKNG